MPARPKSRTNRTAAKTASDVAAVSATATALSRLTPLQLIGRLLLYGVPVLFALQIVAVVVAIPRYAALYAEYQVRLPLFTAITIEYRFLWLIPALVLGLLPFLLPSKTIPRPTVVRLILLIGFVSFLTAQTLTTALLVLPALQSTVAPAP